MSDGERLEIQLKLGSLARHSLPAVLPRRCQGPVLVLSLGVGDRPPPPTIRNSSDKGAGPKWGFREGCSEAVMWKWCLERWVGENQAKSVEKSSPSSGTSLFL